MFLDDVRKLANELIQTTFKIKKVDGNIVNVNCWDIGYRFKFDNAKTWFGRCYSHKKIITLSKPFCLANPNHLDKKIKDTILHEIAHAIAFKIYGMEGANHGRYWKDVAKQVGCLPKAVASTSDFGGIKLPMPKYTYYCEKCGNKFTRHRKPNYDYSCANCSKVYDPKYIMKVIQNY